MNGAVVINKNEGMTSRDVVNKLNKILNTKSIGHIGTLDPLATGVLVCLIGKCTKLSNILVNHNKEYIATFKLGILTDTLDITGKVLKEETKPINEEELKKVLNSYVKTYMQEVPIYSAVKINGKKLYEYARSNEQVVLPKKEVTIYSLSLEKIDKDLITIKTKVSKGCYIRSLIRDIGISLNTYATMISLKRTELGNFNINNSQKLEDITLDNINLIPIENLIKCDIQNINEKTYSKIKNGVIIEGTNEYILFKYNNKNIALYYKFNENKLKPLIMF